MLRMRRCWLVAIVAVASWVQTGKLLAIPDPSCYSKNPKCTYSTERPGGVSCPAGERAWLPREDAAPHCGSNRARERAVVHDYLLARGEFPDGLSVAGGIEVSMKFDGTQQIGRFFSLYLQIKDADGQEIRDNDVELLILSGGTSVVPFTMMRWQNNDGIDAGSVVGEWRIKAVAFTDLFLTRDLPQNSRLAVLVRNKPHGSNKYRLETFPLASIAAKTSLTEPVTHAVLESDPPRAKWTLKFNRSISAASTISWYVADGDGLTTDVTSFVNEKDTAELTIMSEPHRTWEDNSCKALAVRIDSTDNCQATGCRTVMYHLPEVIAAPFGNCN